MANTIGQIGYNQTAITKFHASCVTPESNAITESPAISSQTTRDASARSCETINHIRIGLREGSFVSNSMLLKDDSLNQRGGNFTRITSYCHSDAIYRVPKQVCKEPHCHREHRVHREKSSNSLWTPLAPCGLSRTRAGMWLPHHISHSRTRWLPCCYFLVRYNLCMLFIRISPLCKIKI